MNRTTLIKYIARTPFVILAVFAVYIWIDSSNYPNIKLSLQETTGYGLIMLAFGAWSTAGAILLPKYIIKKLNVG